MDSRALLYEDLCFCRAANYLWPSSLSLSFSLSPFSSLCLYQCISLSFSLHLVPRVPAWLDARTEATYTSVIDFRFNLIKRRCAGFQRICLAFSVWTGKRESYCARCSLEFTIVSLGCHKTVCTPVGPSAEWQSGFLFFFEWTHANYSVQTITYSEECLPMSIVWVFWSWLISSVSWARMLSYRGYFWPRHL